MSQTIEPTVSFSLTMKRAGDALDFYTKAFGAKELFRMPTPGGGVAHGEFMIGNTLIYLSDEAEEWHASAMPEGMKASCLFGIATDSCDAAFARAVEAGATPLSAPQDHFWGARSGMVLDPFGYRWSFNQKLEDLTPEEVTARAQAMEA